MLSVWLQAVVLFLFGMGAMSFIAMVMGCFFLRRQVRSTPRYERGIVLKSPLVPGVSVIAAVSEPTTELFTFVRRLLDLEFGKSELVLVIDGPSDAQMEVWAREFRLCLSARGATDDVSSAPIRTVYESRDPLRLVVVEKEKGGLGDALNAGMRVAAYPVIGLFDPFCHFESTVLLSLIRPMLEDPGRTVGVCGLMPSTERDGKSGAFLPSRFADLESLRLWLARCSAFAGWNLMVPVPGAAMLVTRAAAIGAGGFTAGPLELFLAVHGHQRAAGKAFRIAFVPEGASWARQPRSFDDLRERNQADSHDLAAALRHRRSFGRGLLSISWGLPGILCVRALRPFLETTSYLLIAIGWALGWIHSPMAGLILLSTAGLGMVISMAAVVLKELVEFRGSDPARLAELFLATIPENLGYRQVRNLWLLAGFFAPPPKSPGRG